MRSSPSYQADRHEVGAWQRTSPFAVLFFFVGGLKALAGNFVQLAGTLSAAVLVLRESLSAAVLAAVGVLVLFGIAAVLRYWHFRFRLGEDRVLIRQGVFKKDQLDVQFDRIQGINVEQPLIFRLVGLVTVRFDTAGSARQEGHLPAVSLAFADSLRERASARRHLPEADAPDRLGREVLLRLQVGDMIRIGVTDRSVLAGLAVVPLLWQSFRESIEEQTARVVARATAELTELGALAGAAVVSGVLLVAVALLMTATIASAFLRFYRFELWQEGSKFRSRCGLLTRKEVAIACAKIQQVRLVQSLLMRWFGRYRLRALPATGGSPSEADGVASAQTLNVPLLEPHLARQLLAKMYAGEGDGLSLLPGTDPFTVISPVYIRARVLTVGLAPASLATAILLPSAGVVGLACLAWVPLVALCSWQSWRRRGYMYDADGLAARSGFIGYKVNVFLFCKVQGVTVSRSPLQRRKGLAGLSVHLASGRIVLPFIDYRTACRLRDYMLYKVESSRRPWY